MQHLYELGLISRDELVNYKNKYIGTKSYYCESKLDICPKGYADRDKHKLFLAQEKNITHSSCWIFT